MRWLITGAHGQLGHDVNRALLAAGYTTEPVSRLELDITDAQAVTKAVSGCAAVINCAAYTAVDAAESAEAQAFAVNAQGAYNLAAASATKPFVTVSTDYVFAGDAQDPYPADAAYGPLSAYGRTKAAGEWAVQQAHPAPMILRTAWLYGEHTKGCFPLTMQRLVRERGGVSVVTDQRGQPTWTHDVADLFVRLVQADVTAGIFHATSSGQATWFEFAQAVIASAGFDPAVVTETTSAAFNFPAPRPAYSVLSHDSLTAVGVEPIGPWAQRWATAAPHVLAD